MAAGLGRLRHLVAGKMGSACSASHLTVLLLLARQAGAQQVIRPPALVHEITPIGGPVFGGTEITLNGVGLDGVECIFQYPGANAPVAITSVCRYSPTDPTSGYVCRCTTPRAPQYTELVQQLDPSTGVISMMSVPISDLLVGPVVVTAAGIAGTAFSPFDVTFTYFEYNRVVNVTSIEPTAGHPDLETLVTVRGNGFVNYGRDDGAYCSYPGPSWNPNLLQSHEDYPYRDFTSPATIVSSMEIRCLIPPLSNNSDPVFLEVCINGHPDRASVYRRMRRDDFCTSSLVRFDYVDTAQTNLTLWNSSVIAGPLSGGSVVEIFGKYGFVDFLTLAPETSGLPDAGKPTCVPDPRAAHPVPNPFQTTPFQTTPFQTTPLPNRTLPNRTPSTAERAPFRAHASGASSALGSAAPEGVHPTSRSRAERTSAARRRSSSI